MVFRRQWFVAGLVWGFVGLAASGCGSGGEPAAVPDAYQNLRKIGLAYRQATEANGRPPESVTDLMPFLRKLGDPAAILRSPDDGEEYTILWGVDVLNVRPRGSTWPVLAYEKHGKGGKRRVLQVRFPTVMTDEELRNAYFPPGHKPPAES